MTKIHNAFQKKTQITTVSHEYYGAENSANALKIVVKLQITNFKNITKMHNNGKTCNES